MYSFITKTLTNVKLSAAIMGVAAFSFATPNTAQADEWNMCNWEEIPGSVLERIKARADFPNILERMFDSCPTSALALTDAPTGTVETGPDTRDTAGDRVNNEERPSPSSPENAGPPAGDDNPDSPGDNPSDVFGGLPG